MHYIKEGAANELPHPNCKLKETRTGNEGLILSMVYHEKLQEFLDISYGALI